MGGRGSASSRSGGGGNANIKPNGKEGSLSSLKRDMQSNSSKSQYKMVVDPQTIRQSGFQSTSQLQEYKNEQYFSSMVTNTVKNSIQIEDAPWGGKNTAIVSGRNEAANFVQYLKNNLNVGVESYTNNSWFVKLDRDSNLAKKKKNKKIKLYRIISV